MGIDNPPGPLNTILRTRSKGNIEHNPGPF